MADIDTVDSKAENNVTPPLAPLHSVVVGCDAFEFNPFDLTNAIPPYYVGTPFDGCIKNIGLVAFVEEEKERWRCSKCGGVVCVHRGYCYDCGEKANKQ